MKIKRFFARDMRQAIRKIREELGPDAVILSNRKVSNGIEIVSAIDYDESLFAKMNGAQEDVALQAKTEHAAEDIASEPVAETAEAAAPEWMEDPMLNQMRNELSSLRGVLESQLSHLSQSDLKRTNPLKAAIIRRLEQLGIEESLALPLVSSISPDASLESAWRQTLGILSHQLKVTHDDILDTGGVIALVGPTGVGKTTTIAKLAARYSLRHGNRQVALISTDSYRIGAQEQLLNFGRILDVPTYPVNNARELSLKLNDLQDKRLILIDTAGMSQRDVRLSEQLQTLSEVSNQIKTYLVMAANTQTSTLQDATRTFYKSGLAGAILTKLDETTSLGGSLSTMIQFDLPVAYVSDGQLVPEDLHPARAHSLVSKAVTLMQQHQLLTEKYPLPIMNNGKMANAHV